jgi:hypothetical protein
MALTHWSGGDMRGGSENTSRLGYQGDQRKCSAGGGLKVLAASLALNVPWQQVLRSTAADQRESCNGCASLMANRQSRSAFNPGSG